MTTATSRQAAEALGITRATLYAYVSRGWLQSLEGPERTRRYLWSDIERLKQRKLGPDQAGQSALYGGVAAFSSQICRIAQGQLYYRSHSALELARSWTLPQLAGYLWSGDPHYPLAPLTPGDHFQVDGFLQHNLAWLNDQLDQDPGGWDMSPAGVIRTGWKCFQHFYAQLAGSESWLEKVLMLCADHEMNASTTVARVATSAGANPYAALMAALCTLSGSRHGGACARVEALCQEARAYGSAREAILRRLRRGEALPGFGHPLYPEGDPRAREMLSGHAKGQEWVEAGEELLHQYPSLDLALVVRGEAEGVAFACFASGRILGWVAHLLEQLQDPRMIRPRAVEPEK